MDNQKSIPAAVFFAVGSIFALLATLGNVVVAFHYFPWGLLALVAASSAAALLAFFLYTFCLAAGLGNVVPYVGEAYSFFNETRRGSARLSWMCLCWAFLGLEYVGAVVVSTPPAVRNWLYGSGPPEGKTVGEALALFLGLVPPLTAVALWLWVIRTGIKARIRVTRFRRARLSELPSGQGDPEAQLLVLQPRIDDVVLRGISTWRRAFH
ncbi:hypothetical protein N3K66_005706 [Trichothecium roseum]|uniref:Uncharacterized protein n=1 Tax=Trichothecium roseum TaxID=47278 RepID=A0ACC0UZC5_9HYPO|nr:hypothetical protein N3K66_005706 [Trichothecium roseum]